jgi:hypothetical protein
MLWENAIRVRIKRMLSGNIRQQDIGLIFADLRLLQNLPAEVRDLADFAAHRPNRKRGHTPSSVPVAEACINRRGAAHGDFAHQASNR